MLLKHDFGLGIGFKSGNKTFHALFLELLDISEKLLNLLLRILKHIFIRAKPSSGVNGIERDRFLYCDTCKLCISLE